MTNEEFIKSISLDGEEWQDVPGYEGLYIASIFGRIVALNRKEGIPFAGRSPHLMSPYLTQKGYLKVCLSRDGKSKAIELHRIVAITFIPNPENHKYIDHIDTDKTNNRISNLRWCSAKENANNPITRNHYRLAHLGKRNPGRLRPVVAIKDGSVFKTYNTLADVVLDGFSKRVVFYECNKKQKRSEGLQWFYLDDYEKSISSSTSPEQSLQTCETDIILCALALL